MIDTDKSFTLYTGVSNGSWEAIWKDKNLSKKLTNCTSDLEFAFDYSYDFQAGTYDDLAVEISNIPLAAFSAVRPDDYSDDDDFESLNELSDEDKLKMIGEHTLFLVDLEPYKNSLRFKLIDK